MKTLKQIINEQLAAFDANFSKKDGWVPEETEPFKIFLANATTSSLLAYRDAVGSEYYPQVLEALAMMYEQYCDDGHHFMSAGERASLVLEMMGVMKPDGAGRGEINWKKIQQVEIKHKEFFNE